VECEGGMDCRVDAPMDQVLPVSPVHSCLFMAAG
jgi:hypothetical protein